MLCRFYWAVQATVYTPRLLPSREKGSHNIAIHLHIVAIRILLDMRVVHTSHCGDQLDWRPCGREALSCCLAQCACINH